MFLGLCRLLKLVIYRVSATNCAQTYERSEDRQKGANFSRENWQFGTALTTKNVWDAVILLCLLENCNRAGKTLLVPRTGKQKDWFTQAMEVHNEQIIQDGQPEISHYCDRCMKTFVINGMLVKSEVQGVQSLFGLLTSQWM